MHQENMMIGVFQYHFIKHLADPWSFPKSGDINKTKCNPCACGPQPKELCPSLNSRRTFSGLVIRLKYYEIKENLRTS